MRLNKLIRDFFGFSRTEVNGTLVLIPLIILLLFTPYLYRQVLSSDPYTSAEDERLLDSLVLLINASFVESKEVEVKKVEYFKFDPNTASVEELTSLGVPKFLAKRIDNYRSIGGKFLNNADLLKIYDFPDSIYDLLSPFIFLSESKKSPIKAFVKPEAREDSSLVLEDERVPLKEVLAIDINTADTTSFKELKGIGPSYARRITSYRKLLGGYHSINQLKEVYGMTDTLFQSISPFLLLSDSSSVKRLAINLATFKELLAHPYINYEQTKEILNIKSKNGKFRKAEDMYRLSLMDSVMIKRLLPYLDFK
ncbi:helix-hairpin-helix domain-containing protein [Roseivirga sp. E12]|uniref:helix-hairpin-helix domain-containing protein n=1 Tax=Roseivirga sp. E12 TaxID=2819237 RepID=UPI001ABD07A3|nr:helix-hairpin-helix domain-containing protein [Roseivirga sp. E12]MBO3700783.1 helix-hairpin-helix domain-containing protein [Roseivirga sp. E12]